MLFTAALSRIPCTLESFPYTIRISPDVISQEVLLGETLLMDVGTLAYFGLDSLGTSVWREMQASQDADEVFRRLLKTSGLTEEALAVKYRGILQGLEVSKIIRLEEKLREQTEG